MTERLYYFDSYLRHFEASIAKLTETKSGIDLVLDRTAFYPTSGGQPHDLGTIQGCQVREVFENDENEIVHRLDRPVEAAILDCQIDWKHRFDHMQQHTGQHVLSQAFVKTGRLDTVGFHLGSDGVTSDLDSETVSPQLLSQAEKLANEIVFENRPIKVRIVPPEDVAGLSLRKESRREGPLRVVEVEDFDVSACGGTHVKRTGEIGTIIIRKLERVNRQARVEFVCGQRALAAYRNDRQHLTAIARQFSVGIYEASARVEKQIQEARQLRKALHEKNKALAGLLARELVAEAVEVGGFRIIRKIFEDEEMDFLKLLAQAMVAQGSCVVLLGSGGSQGSLVFAAAETWPADLRPILADCCPLIEGKGGGTRTFVQAGGRKPSGVEQALVLAARRVGIPCP